MGQASSSPQIDFNTVGQGKQKPRLASGRQSTRSLPDARCVPKGRHVDCRGTSKSRSYGNFQRSNALNSALCANVSAYAVEQNCTWNAAPYYAPQPKIKTAKGPRSLDINLRRQDDQSCQEATDHRRRVGIGDAQQEDRWSDVASDMYRLSRSAQSKSSRWKRKIDDRKKRHLDRKIEENRIIEEGFQESSILSGSFTMDCRRKGNPKRLPSMSIDSSSTKSAERPVAFNGRNFPPNFDVAHGRTIRRSTHVNNLSPSKSSSCERVIIQSLWSELSAERSARAESDRHVQSLNDRLQLLKMEKCLLEKQTCDMKAKLDSVDERLKVNANKQTCQIEELQQQVTTLRQELENGRRANAALSRDKQSQHEVYEHCLNEIANKIAEAVVEHQILKQELQRFKSKSALVASSACDTSSSSEMGSSNAVDASLVNHRSYDDRMNLSAFITLSDEAACEALCSRPVSLTLDAAESNRLFEMSPRQMNVSTETIIADCSNPSISPIDDVQFSIKRMLNAFREGVACTQESSTSRTRSVTPPTEKDKDDLQRIVNLLRVVNVDSCSSNVISKDVWKSIKCSTLPTNVGATLDDGYCTMSSEVWLDSCAQETLPACRSSQHSCRRCVVKRSVLTNDWPLVSKVNCSRRLFKCASYPSLFKCQRSMDARRLAIAQPSSLIEIAPADEMGLICAPAPVDCAEALCSIQEELLDSTLSLLSKCDESQRSVSQPTCSKEKETAARRSCKEDVMSTTSTSSASSDDWDTETRTMVAWLKQLKMRKNRRRYGVVRYLPPDFRPSILRPDIFCRFRREEQEALSCFDFLTSGERASPTSSRPQAEVVGDGRSLPKARKISSAKSPRAAGRQQVATPKRSASVDDLYASAKFIRKANDHRTQLKLSKKFKPSDCTMSAESVCSSNTYCSSSFLNELCAGDQTCSSNSSLSFFIA